MCTLFFFFQAEDGIRDLTVTGVQTCALPIFWRQSRKPAVGRIDNLRGPRPGALRGKEGRGIIGAIDLTFGREPREDRRSFFVQISALLLGEKFLVPISGRALHRRIKFFSPNAL